MNYQVDYGNGYENVLPDGHGMHVPCSFHAKEIIKYNFLSANGFFEITHSDLQEIKAELNSTEPGASWDEFARNVLKTDRKAVIKALKAKESGKKILHSTDDDGHYFLVLDEKGPLGLCKARAEYTVVHDENCESCWSPESGDPDVWFDAIFEQGAERARCGSGAWQYEYTADEWRMQKWGNDLTA